MRRLANTLIPALIAGLAFGCRPLASPGAAPAGPRASIEAPAQGSALPFGPVEIVLHASNRAGVSQVELWIDGAVFASLPSPDPKLRQVTMRQTWEPTLAGTYLLQVRARDARGAWGPYASTQVTIREREVTATPAPTLTATPTATPAPTGTPAPTATRTRPAGPTRAPGPTETPIVIGAPSATPVPAATGRFAVDTKADGVEQMDAGAPEEVRLAPPGSQHRAVDVANGAERAGVASAAAASRQRPSGRATARYITSSSAAARTGPAATTAIRPHTSMPPSAGAG